MKRTPVPLAGDNYGAIQKRTIAVCRCSECASFGFVQRRKETRGDIDGTLFYRALPGAGNPTIQNNYMVEDIAPSVELCRIRRVKHGAAISVANGILVKIW